MERLHGRRRAASARNARARICTECPHASKRAGAVRLFLRLCLSVCATVAAAATACEDCRTCAMGDAGTHAELQRLIRRGDISLIYCFLLPEVRRNKTSLPREPFTRKPPDFAPRQSVRPPPLPPAARAGPVDVHSHGVRRASYAAEHALVMRFGCPGWRARDRGVLGIVLPSWRDGACSSRPWRVGSATRSPPLSIGAQSAALTKRETTS